MSLSGPLNDNQPVTFCFAEWLKNIKMLALLLSVFCGEQMLYVVQL
jgi:hypothetical protein